MADVDVSVQIQTPSGFVELEDQAGGYELHAECFASRQVGQRKSEVTAEWYGGTYVWGSVPDQVAEDLVFYVSGATPYETATRLQTVVDAFESLSWQLVYRFGDLQETWQCTPADYSLESNQPLMFATKVIVRARVPRNPVVAREQVTP